MSKNPNRTDVEERMKAREAMFDQKLQTQRRLARPEDFVWDRSQEKFWDLEDRVLLGAISVDAAIPLSLWRVEVEEGDPAPAAAAAEGEEAPKRKVGRPKKRREKLVRPTLDIMRIENNQTVEGATWFPGMPPIVEDMFIDDQGPRYAKGRRFFNKYIPPSPHVLEGGVAAEAEPWIAHVRKLFPDPAVHEYLFDYFAHMLQFTAKKCNAAIVLSGTQGIGKDAMLEPLKRLMGAPNVQSIDPDDVFSDYTPWAESVMLVINEVRPTDSDHRASDLYNRLKPVIAAPPHTLPVKQKFEKTRHAINVARVILTTNDYQSMFIPANDRRMFIAHSTLPERWHELEGTPGYFRDLFGWFETGLGVAHVGAWLQARDLSRFDAGMPPQRTEAWRVITDGWDDGDDAVSQALDILGSPNVLFSGELLGVQFDRRREIETLVRSPRRFALRMQRDGYEVRRAKNELPSGDRWVFQAAGGRFASKSVFVKTDAFTSAADMSKAIQDHGMHLAELRGQGIGEDTGF